MFFLYSLGILAIICSSVNGKALTKEKIIGGVAIDITQAPYTVAVLADPSNIGSFNHICGGVIITQTRILTSAQCTNNFPLGFLRIRAGATYHYQGGQVLQVFSYRQHENYNSVTYANDIAIVNLDSYIILGANAAVIPLAPQNATPLDGTTCTLTGWGRLSIDGISPEYLHMVTMSTINHNICDAAYSGINEVTSGMICTGRQGIGGVGSCRGDTGGPLVVSGVLYGLASWGIGCGEPNYPSIFTKVSTYTNWIYSN